jgi:Domain of unknown function (DUF4292)
MNESPRPRRLEALILSALAALALAGCPAKPPALRPYPPPTPGALAAALAAQQAAVRSMNARARATSWLGGERVRATVLMLVTRAGQLRLEAEVSLQGTVATLATDGVHFALLDAHANELRRGPACPENVASLVRIPLAPVEVAAILLGDVDLGGPPADAGLVAWDAAHSADVWTVATASGMTHLSFRGDGASRVLVGVTVDGGNGARLWQTAYEDFVTEGGVRVPSVIRFAEGRGSFDEGVEVRFKDRTLNVTPRASDFALQAPPGVTIKDVGCGGG